MKIILTKSANLTEALGTYFEKKLASLAKYVKHFEAEGEVSLGLEIFRVTKRHRKGDIFTVAADLRLPKKILRAEVSAGDVRTAIDGVRDTLRIEIAKHKTQVEKPKRAKAVRAWRGK